MLYLLIMKERMLAGLVVNISDGGVASGIGSPSVIETHLKRKVLNPSSNMKLVNIYYLSHNNAYVSSQRNIELPGTCSRD